jgi:hypothetical protein
MKIDTLITKYTNKVDDLKKQLKEAEGKLSLLRELQLESVLDSLSDLSKSTSCFANGTLSTTSLSNFNNSFFPPCDSWDYFNNFNKSLAPDAIKPLNINDIQIKPLNLDDLRKF